MLRGFLLVRFCVAALFGVILLEGAWALSMDVVTVGNPGNAADASYGGFGAVSYSFAIGKYEVTNVQYAVFLNAVASTEDTYSLFPATDNPLQPNNDRNVAHTLTRGISRQGVAGSFFYSVEANMADKPVNFTTWFSAARFVNWMANGQPVGGQGVTTTENGAYALDGILTGGLDIVRNTINPNTSAALSFWLPSEDEWYKAAFYDPTLAVGAGGYWLYPTRSMDTPVVATATGTGEIANPGANVANYASGSTWNGQFENLTTVGSAGEESASYYGTYDQGGNVWEWSEAVVKNGTARGLRQASANDPVVVPGGNNYIAASFAGNGRPPEDYFWNAGFRIAASVPEPSASFLLFAGGVIVLSFRLGRKMRGK